MVITVTFFLHSIEKDVRFLFLKTFYVQFYAFNVTSRISVLWEIQFSYDYFYILYCTWYIHHIQHKVWNTFQKHIISKKYLRPKRSISIPGNIILRNIYCVSIFDWPQYTGLYYWHTLFSWSSWLLSDISRRSYVISSLCCSDI